MPGPGSKSGSPKSKIADSSSQRDNRRRIDNKQESPSPTINIVPEDVGHSGSQTSRRIDDNIFYAFKYEGEWQYILSTDSPRDLQDQINEDVTEITVNVEAAEGTYEDLTVTNEIILTGATITGLSHNDLDDLSDDDHCFSDDTELLTQKGFVKYQDISKKTKALTLNLKTNKLEYNQVKEKYVYSSFKEMISFKNRYGEILVTPKHTMLYRNTCKPEKTPLSKFLTCTAEEAIDKTVFRVPTSAPKAGKYYDKPLEFFTVLGLIISDGHFTYPKTEGYGVLIYDYSGDISYIKDKLGAINAPYTVQSSGNTIYIRSAWARENIRTWITEKRIPKKLMGLRGEQFKAFMAGMFYGDGGVRARGEDLRVLTKGELCDRFIDNYDGRVSYSYYTGDKVLKEQLCHLTTLNNIRAYDFWRNGGFKDGCWNINFSNREDILFGKKNKRVVPYSGKVWCVSVENKTLVLRRNGLIFIAGNTQYILHSLADAANDFLVASADDSYVKKTLAETGAILEGDIEHDNLQAIPANDHIDHTGVDVTAGAGLIGGGNISVTRTINVGAGNGITVNADDIEVIYGNAANTAVVGNTYIEIIAGAGVTGGGSANLGDGFSITINVIAGDGITVNADSIEVIYGADVGQMKDVDLTANSVGTGAIHKAARIDHGHVLDQTITPTWTGLHTFGTAGIQMQTGIKIQFVGANQWIVGSGTGLTIDADNDLYLVTDVALHVTAPYSEFSGTMRINAPYDTTLGYTTMMQRSTGGRHLMSGQADYQENISLLSIYEEGDSYDTDFGTW